MANRIFYTPQLSFPRSVKFADCLPTIATPDRDIAIAYNVQNYIPRSMWRQWNKGVFSPPFLITTSTSGTTVSYTIFFNDFSGAACPEFNCNLQCATQDIVLTQGGDPVSNTTFCINGERPIYHFDVEFSTEGEILALPATFEFSFTDSLNNQTTQIVDSISNMQPAAPLVGAETDSSGAIKMYVGAIFQSHTFNDFKNDGIEEFIIERSDWASQTNTRTFSGYWKIPATDTMFVDTDVSTGQRASYRIKFRNKWGEESLFSDWVASNY